MARKSYEQHLAEARAAAQEAQERPQRPLDLSHFFVPLRQMGPLRRSRDDPNNEWLGVIRVRGCG